MTISANVLPSSASPMGAHRLLQLRLARERHAAWCRAVPPRLRDPLTGQGLLPDTVALYAVRGYDPSRPQSLQAPIPYANCTRETDNGGGGTHPARRNKYALGGACWTPRFAAYIADALTLEGTLAQQVENRYTADDWYRVDYVVPKVRARFGGTITDALLMVLRDRRERDEVCDELCRPRSWLSRAERNVAKWVQQQFGLGGRVGPLDGGHEYRADCPCAPCQRERARDVARFAGGGEETYAGGSFSESVTVA